MAAGALSAVRAAACDGRPIQFEEDLAALELELTTDEFDELTARPRAPGTEAQG